MKEVSQIFELNIPQYMARNNQKDNYITVKATLPNGFNPFGPTTTSVLVYQMEFLKVLPVWLNSMKKIVAEKGCEYTDKLCKQEAEKLASKIVKSMTDLIHPELSVYSDKDLDIILHEEN